MNNRSSRSHTIFSFKVEVRGTGHNSLSTMQVVDLAGRENEQTSECKDERFRELRFINRSLFELANCISALCDGNREHVPFRNSKLTMLLSDSLSSNSRTTLLATLTPSPTGFDENMLTCRKSKASSRRLALLHGARSGASDWATFDAAMTTCSEVGEPVCHDGLEPLTLRLDEDSVMCYLPQLLESPSRATSCYTALAETLQRLLATVPAPPKAAGGGCAGASCARVYRLMASTGCEHQNPPPASDMFARNLKEVLYLKERVEEETLRTLQGLPDECREVAHGLSEQAESLGSELEPFFNSVLVNFYLDGRAQIKWHADDEHLKTSEFSRVTTQPVANRFAAAEVARRLQDEIASLKPMVVEPNTPLADELTLRETLLRQFSLVWAEDGQDHEAGSKWRGMEKCQGLEHTNHSASSALKQVGAKLSTLQRAIQAKGGVIHEAVSPATTARSEHSDGGHALRGPSGRGNAGRRLSEEKAGLAARTGAPPVASFYRVFVTVV
eukprot:g66.t2